MRQSPKTSAGKERAFPDRLSPEMASFRLLVLAFVRDYIGMMGVSPSYGEIAARMDNGCTRSRVRAAVKSLVRDGLLIKIKGHRGLRLPSIRQEAIKQLRDLGWVVDEDSKTALRPRPNPTLLPPPGLDYTTSRDPLSRDGETDGDTRSKSAGSRAG